MIDFSDFDFDLDDEIYALEGVIPEGWHRMRFATAESKFNRKKDGKLIALSLVAEEGDYKGDKVFDWINTHNPNKVCERLGRKTLKKIKDALCIQDFKSPSQMLGRLIDVRIVHEDSGTYGTQARVADYREPQSGPSLQEAPPQKSSSSSSFDDEIPF